MEEVDDKTQAAAAIRLQANVSKLIRDEVLGLLQDWTFMEHLVLRSSFMVHFSAACRSNMDFYNAVKTVILAVDHERSYLAKAPTNAVQGQIRP